MGWRQCDKVKQTDGQIVGMPPRRRKRLVVHDLKVNQSRASGRWIEDHVRHRAVAMRPPIIEIRAPQFVCAAKLSRGGLDHARCQRALQDLREQILARKSFDTDSVPAKLCRLPPIVEQAKALNLSPLPLMIVGQELDWNSGNAKE